MTNVQSTNLEESGTNTQPARAGRVLATLILVAVVANMNLAVVNVALPDIGRSLDASQLQLNLIAVGYSLGLAASVLFFGAIGDRYGRKQMLLWGMLLSVPTTALAAWAPSAELLIVARVLGGLTAGMAYPTTLALITACWSGPSRVRAIALWSAVGGAAMACAALASGALVNWFWWGSVFVISIPLALVAAWATLRCVPNHVNETTERVDFPGGLFSMIFVGTLTYGINIVTEPSLRTMMYWMFAIAIVSGIAFVVRQLRTKSPLYDLRVAARPTFWVAAAAGIIVFGALMGGMFIGQQYLQNVLGYSALEAGFATIPAALAMVAVARFSARLTLRFGSRITLLIGFSFLLVAFMWMFVMWDAGASYWGVGVAYLLVGVAVGIAGTPASQSLTASVPVERVGMASGTADIERDLGGAIMQSLLGAFLTAGYSASIVAQVGAAEAKANQSVSDQVVTMLQRSYASAESIAERYPAYAQQIITGARQAFLDGQHWAYGVGIVAIVVGMVVTSIWFPRHGREQELLETYRTEAAPPAHNSSSHS
ncbi:MAG: MFS transporter [Acidimicrobiia bacterium]